MNAATVLPDPDQLRLESICAHAEAITFVVSTRRPGAACPTCGRRSERVHSRYRRSVADLPWQGIPVRLRLWSRRFFCDRPDCPRQVFTERLPGMVPRYGRRTERLSAALRLIAYAVGGEAGARLIVELGMAASPDTLLRLLCGAASGPAEAPRVLGVDDFAFRKGQSYGTLLVDLERRFPVEMLPDRQAQTLARWLQEHPGVEIVTRDRSAEYARGIREGARQAVQVTDRFHLLANAREMLERAVERSRHRLRGVAIPRPQVGAATDEPTESGGQPRLPRRGSPAEQAIRQARQQRWLSVRQQVHARRGQGENVLSISIDLGLNRGTVYRYLRQEPKSGSVRSRWVASILDPFLPYLSQRWSDGCRSGMQLWRELRERGYPGSRKMVAVWTQHQRTRPASTTPRKYLGRPKVEAADGGAPARASPAPAASARQISWFLLRDPASLGPAEAATLAAIHQAAPQLATLQPLVRQFGRVVRQRDPAAYGDWRERALNSGICDLAAFVAGLDRDQDAVLAALSLPWSNGWVEGQVNRLKLIKRQMYGRANFALLRARVLPAV